MTPSSRMRVVRSVAAMQRWAKCRRREGTKVGFVPTMGYLHAGHLSLVLEARRRVRDAGKVVVSIYVNPTQFGPQEDLARYPRDLERDLALCRQAGVDVVFVPADAEMYRGDEEAEHSTYVVEECLARGMEGAARPTHFRGVTTVVAKLFNLVLPDVAVFGAKDYQQAAVARRMVRDLNFPVQVVVAPTVREPDGLAMSSRNRYLDAAERQHAVILWRVLNEARARVRAARRGILASRLERHLRRCIASFEPSGARTGGPGHELAAARGPGGGRVPAGSPAIRVDYVAFFDPDTLRPARRVTRGIHLALAVRVGGTRLIDNARLD